MEELKNDIFFDLLYDIDNRKRYSIKGAIFYNILGKEDVANRLAKRDGGYI